MLRPVPFALMVLVGLIVMETCPPRGLAQTFVVRRDPALGYNVVPDPYWGYTINPYASVLHGVADTLRAQGEYGIMKQTARLEQEKVRRARLETRKAQLEQWKWERDFHAQEWLDKRGRSWEVRVLLAQDAMVPEIISGTALNTLCKDLMNLYDRAGTDPSGTSVSVDPKVLPNINVTSANGGNAGLLKQDRISWPLFLLQKDFSKRRDEIEAWLREAREHARGEGLSAEVLINLNKNVLALEKALVSEVRHDEEAMGWSGSDYVSAKRFLKELREALLLLKNPKDAAFFLGHSLQGDNVYELVRHMRGTGLWFAPATDGNQRHYLVLYDALAKESKRLGGTRSPGLGPR